MNLAKIVWTSTAVALVIGVAITDAKADAGYGGMFSYQSTYNPTPGYGGTPGNNQSAINRFITSAFNALTKPGVYTYSDLQRLGISNKLDDPNITAAQAQQILNDLRNGYGGSMGRHANEGSWTNSQGQSFAPQNSNYGKGTGFFSGPQGAVAVKQ
jgi:hypothetical protein